MQKFLFILGRNWRLALAEIDMMLRTQRFQGYITDYSANCAIVQFESYDEEENLLRAEDLMVRLGSVQKIGIMHDFIDIEMFRNAFPEEMEGNRTEIYDARDYIEGLLKDMITQIFPEIKDKKIFVANSIYPVAFSDSYYKTIIQHFLQFVNKYLTKQLKEMGAKKAIYFKYPMEKIQSGNLNPIFPHHFFRYELYKDNKSEILYCLTEEGMYIGKTYTVVDSNFQKQLDEERPIKDFRQTIPPKFAKTLLSFCQIEPPLQNKKVLDPFCGQGTILQFGHLIGAQMYGADIKEEHVEASRQNLEYTGEVIGRDLSKKQLKKRVIKSDISEIEKRFQKESFDAIITEPLLFPLFRKFPSYKETKNIIRDEIAPLYKELIRVAYNLLKPGCRIALVSPVIYDKYDKINVPIEGFATHYKMKSIKLLNSERIFDSPREDLNISEYDFVSIMDTGSKKLAREFFLLQKPDNSV